LNLRKSGINQVPAAGTLTLLCPSTTYQVLAANSSTP
jgi:hypothetical protein